MSMEGAVANCFVHLVDWWPMETYLEQVTSMVGGVRVHCVLQDHGTLDGIRSWTGIGSASLKSGEIVAQGPLERDFMK